MTRVLTAYLFAVTLLVMPGFSGDQLHGRSLYQGSDQFDHSAFNALLAKHVDDKGLVRYEGFMSNVSFQRYLEKLAAADISALSKNEKLAFYINAYNALVIRQVLDNWPLSSPMDVKGFFTNKIFTVAGKKISLDVLEKKRIIPLGGSLVHFAVVCAANSCPKLLPRAYSGASIRKQLEINARYFVNNSTVNRLDMKSKTFYLSKIFDWYESDFRKDYGSLMAFIRKFIATKEAAFLKSNRVTVKHNSYNWELNSR